MSDLIRRVRTSPFWRDESGSATVEILLWMPFFLFLVFLTVDASMLYWRHGEMYNVARDVARSIAGSTLDSSQAAVNDFVTNRLQSNFTVTANVSGGLVTVNVSRAPGTLTTFSVFEDLVGSTIDASVTMIMEPPPGSLSDGTFGGFSLPGYGDDTGDTSDPGTGGEVTQ